jgi:hypothetical protein
VTATRRELLLAAAPARLVGDAAVLEAAFGAERAAEAAYAAARTSGDRRVRALAGRFAAHERQHVAALSTAFQALGAPAPPAPEGPAGLDAAVRDLGLPAFTGLRGGDDLLRFLVALEELLVGRWVRAHRDLGDANLTQTATQVLGCQAQHLVALRDALGRPALASAVATPRG